jgi:hypothetical protein
MPKHQAPRSWAHFLSLAHFLFRTQNPAACASGGRLRAPTGRIKPRCGSSALQSPYLGFPCGTAIAVCACGTCGLGGSSPVQRVNSAQLKWLALNFLSHAINTLYETLGQLRIIGCRHKLFDPCCETELWMLG